MNYFIIEDINNPLDKFCILQTSMSYYAVKDLIDEAEENAEEHGNYVMDEFYELIKDDPNTLIISDFSTMYI